MADNVITNAGSGGATFVTAAFSWSGDTAHAAGCFVGIVSGSEGAWTFSPLVGGAGAVAAGVQRMTLASDDPAVVKLTSIDGKLIACNTGAVVIASGSCAVTNAGTFAVQAAQSGTWNVGTLTSITNTVSVSAASLPLPAGAATDATLTAIAGYLDTEIASGVGHLATIAGAVSATHVQVDVLTAPTTAVTQSGSWSVGVTGSVAVTGTFWQATQPVSGTVSAAQSGTWTVQPGNTANTTAWLVTGTGGTFPITAASLPLPAGAATSALQGGGLPAALGAGGGLKVDGSGTALPVSGSVAVSSVGGSVAVTGTFWQATQPVSLASVPSHAVTNAGTFAVQVTSAPTTAITAAALPLPAGASTSALQGAGLPAALGAGGGLKVDGSGTALPVSLASTTITGSVAVTGTFWQTTQPVSLASVPSHEVTQATATNLKAQAECYQGGSAVATGNALYVQAGTGATFKLASNTGVDIGDVDITSIVPGTGTTNLGKAEDAGHTSGDVGVMALAVRQDTAAALATTDADYAPLEVDAIGRLHANATDISGVVYDGTTLCTVKRFHAVCADGDSLIAAVASKKFRILSFAAISLSGTIARFWLDDADATAVFGSTTGFAIEEDAGAGPPGFILPHNPHGWFQTPTANKALRVQYASGTGAIFFGTYIEVA
jgi:hypothetical protein